MKFYQLALCLGLLWLASCNAPTAPPSLPTSLPTEVPSTLVQPPAVTAAPSPTSAGVQPTEDPFAIDIQIDPFPDGSVFTNPGPVWINGTVDRMPFEKNLTYQVFDTSGNLVKQGPVTVEGEYGSPGTFTLKLDFEPGQTGDFKIRIVNFSAEDGREQGAAEVEITLQ